MITKAWRVLTVHAQPALLCLLCDRVSFHPDDIAERRCGWCGVWLAAVAEWWCREDAP